MSLSQGDGRGTGRAPDHAGRRAPRRVLVVGAGIVGLSCAWSLQDHGVDVVVVDRRSPGSGASWQNAGYVSPSLCMPLPEPAILREGLRALVRPRSPIGFLRPTEVDVARFAVAMARHCTSDAWRRSMATYRVLNAQVTGAYEHQREGGVETGLTPTDVLACFETPGEGAGFFHELEGVAGAGQPVEVALLTGDEARDVEPHLTRRISVAVRVGGQHFLTPSRYVGALADAVRTRGALIVEGLEVTSVERRGPDVVVRGGDQEMEADAVVLAAGAWLGGLARDHGVRVAVHGGRGYSFTARCDKPLSVALAFPAVRVALTPQGSRARVSGIMEVGSPDAPARPERFESIARGASPLLVGVDLAARRDEWVGARPLSADGLPLVGETATPGVYVAGGHGMWGVTLGPLTGALLAERIVTGRSPAPLAALDPCRRG